MAGAPGAGADVEGAAVSPAFEQAFARTVGHEGGYQAHPEDRGNWTGGRVGVGELKGTNFGISAASYPHLDIKGLTVEAAKLIYLRDFWHAIRGDELPAPIAIEVFDGQVHHGDAAKFMLQRALRVAADGVIGPITIAAAQAADVCVVRARFLGERLLLMTDLSTWGAFGRGWARRIGHNLTLIKAA